MVNQLRAISGIQNQGLLRQPVFVLFRAFMGTVSLASPGSSPSFDGAAAAASFLTFALECFFPVAGACGFSNTILPSPGFGTGPCTKGVSIFHALFGFLTLYRVTARYSRYSGKALTHTLSQWLMMMVWLRLHRVWKIYLTMNDIKFSQPRARTAAWCRWEAGFSRPSCTGSMAISC